ncbi:GIY-YIG nuclease family protein [Crocosphaera sp.]|uniref:GIY-YIG nuclease family protein n=1 Tax=Crocosphaera sp. TaxID=2729996 RepID=UPI002613E75D|nr:GIY-YIG nuclease family protein [Crocosphaera sp.]MDJ0578829.1 GIY-YIG nuclease family protein [Crocosphaera sp.]
MVIDTSILALPKVSLENRENLPQVSGIYYVIDQNHIIWYIGQAKDFQARWKSKSHHRLFQLKSQKKTKFEIYYQVLESSKLNEIEQQEISKYHPRLNQSKVKHKNVRPSETLLRETLIKLSGYIVVLGIEPPRELDSNLIQQCKYYNESWWVQKKVLKSNVIHLGLNATKISQFANEEIETFSCLIDNPFKSRKNYSNKWQQPPGTKKNPHIAVGQCARILINGFVIEVSLIYGLEDLLIDKKETYLASENIFSLSQQSLNKLKNGWFKALASIYPIKEEIKENKKNYPSNLVLSRLQPYTEDPIPLVFKEKLDKSILKNHIQKIKDDYKLGKRGIGSRSKKTQEYELTQVNQKKELDKQNHTFPLFAISSWSSRLLKYVDRLPLYSGIYIVEIVANSQHFVFYVGQAKNLRSSWIGDKHHLHSQLDRCKETLFYMVYYHEFSEEKLNEKQRYYIELLDPILNI